MANPTKQQPCEKFYDIYEKPSGQRDEELTKLNERNERNAKLYAAVKEVLEDDFNIKLPPDPKHFPGDLKGDALAQAIGILGIIQADNWQDPSNGKTSPNPDDRRTRGTNQVIDRRFIDAVVDAVKEYTSSSALYNNVFELMLAEAAQGVQAQTTTT